MFKLTVEIIKFCHGVISPPAIIQRYPNKTPIYSSFQEYDVMSGVLINIRPGSRFNFYTSKNVKKHKNVNSAAIAILFDILQSLISK